MADTVTKLFGGNKPVDFEKEERKQKLAANQRLNRRLASAEGRSSTITNTLLGLPGPSAGGDMNSGGKY